MIFWRGCKARHVCGFSRAEDAARAYDELARQHGINVVNFPVAERGEVKAVFGEHYTVTMQRARPAPLLHRKQQPRHTTAAAVLVPAAKVHSAGSAQGHGAQRSGAPPVAPSTKYNGVICDTRVAEGGLRFRAQLCVDGMLRHLGSFKTAEAAARAHDSVARATGKVIRVNFPKDDVERAAIAEWRRGGCKRTPSVRFVQSATAAPHGSPTPMDQHDGTAGRAFLRRALWKRMRNTAADNVTAAANEAMAVSLRLAPNAHAAALLELTRAARLLHTFCDAASAWLSSAHFRVSAVLHCAKCIAADSCCRRPHYVGV